MRDVNRRRASPGELREASQRYKELQDELRQMDLTSEARHGEERLDRYERELRLQAMREEFQAGAETQLPTQQGGMKLALVMTVASFLLCSFCAGGTYFGLTLLTQKPSMQSVADGFWTSMEQKDYATAHDTYFSPTLKVQLSIDQFTTQANAADTQYGAVVSAALVNQEVGKTTALLTYNVQRGRKPAYPVSITLESVQGNWGISDYGSTLSPPSVPAAWAPSAPGRLLADRRDGAAAALLTGAAA